MAVSRTLLDFFEARIRETYALDEKHKQDILARVAELDEARIGIILDTIVQYERSLGREAQEFSEDMERQKESVGLERSVNALFY